MEPLVALLNGATAMASLVVALIFFGFWRDSRDRLFVFFAVAFGLMALNWMVPTAVGPAPETRHWFFLMRLAAFLLIAIAILDKNRAARTRRTRVRPASDP
jgi:hypothetical protein